MIRVTFTRRSLAIGLAAFISTFVASAQQSANILPAEPLIFAGTGPGGGLVHVFQADGTEVGAAAPFGSGFTGGVRVAAGDVNGDGVTDAIVGMASAGNHVRVYSGADAAALLDVTPFGSGFTGGVFLAAGDVNGDAHADILVGAGPGSGLVKLIDGATLTDVGAGYPFGPAFTGGVTVALGDVTGDGGADLLFGMAIGGLVRLFDGATIAEIAAGFPYGPLFTGGVNVAMGDVDGDGIAEIVTAPRNAGGPVQIFTATGALLGSGSAFVGVNGVNIAIVDLNEDGRGDLVVAPGSGEPRLRAFSVLEQTEVLNTLAFDPTFLGGVNVGVSGPIGTRFTSADATTFTVGVAGSFEVTTSNGTGTTLTVGGTLPAGVGFADHGDGTGTLSGTPEAGSGGDYALNLVASRDGAQVASQAFTLTVQDPPAITSADATTFMLETPGTFVVTTTGFPTPEITLTGPLPDGVTFTDNGDGTATLDGTPESAGVFPLTLTATNPAGTATQSFTLTVEDVPVANADTYTVNEGGTLTVPAGGVIANDTNVVGTLTATLVAGPTHATSFTFSSDGSFSYTHDGSETPLTDTFTYQINDGTQDSNVATVTITITPQNDAPVATHDAYSVAEGGSLLRSAALGVLANDTDVDSPALTAVLVTGPTQAAVFTLNADGSFSYLHDGSETVTDSFTYRASDGTAESTLATVTITITPVADGPTAVNDTYAVAELGTLTVPAPGVLGNDQDSEGAGLTAVLVSGPAHATAFVLNPDGSFTYTNNGDEAPSDTFTYHAHAAGGLDSNVATVTISIANVNDPPAALPDSYSVSEGGTLTPAAPGVLGNDLDPDSVLTASLVSGPAHASAFTLNPDGSFSYTHDGSETPLTDSFTYAASDGIAPPSTATVTITITPVSEPPALDLDADDSSGATGADYQLTVTEGDPATFIQDATDATITDADSPTLSSITVTLTNLLDPTFEVLDVDLVTGGFDANFTKAYDPTTDPTKGVLTITATTPQPLADFVTLLRRVTYQNTDLDPDATARVIEVLVHDGIATSNTATSTVTVVPVVNQPPVATDDVGATTEDTVLTVPAGTGVLSNDTDPDASDTLIVVAVTGGTVGAPFTTAKGATLTLHADGSYVYNPTAAATLQALRAGLTDTDSVTYTVGDGEAQDTATLTITVTGVNDAPAGTDTTVSTNEGAAYTFTAADFGFTDPIDTPDDGFLAVRITTLPALGTLTLSGGGVAAGQSIPVASLGNLVFTPAADGSGTPYTSFTFQVQDNGGTANGGVDLDPSANTLTINVNSVNDAPAGTNTTITLLEDATRAFTAADFGFTDPNDTPPNTLQSVLITTLPAAGTITLSGVGITAGTEIPAASIPNLVFTPAANGSGTPYTTFTFQVRDDGGTANGGVDLDPSANTITFNVTAVNDAPSGTNTTVTTDEDVQYTFTVANFGFTDPNDTPAHTLQSVVITTLPAVGSLTLSGAPFAAGTEITVANITAGNLRYLSPPNAFGSPFTTFTFQVRDNGGTANGGVDLDPSANTITINVNPVNDAPLVVNETFDVLGNTELRVDMTAGTTPHTSETTTGATAVEGVLDNDGDPEGDPFAVTGILNCIVPDTTPPFDCTLTDGAVVHVEANGEFSYTPGPGDTVGSFTYTVTDTPAAGVPASVNGTVTFTFFDMIWYVDADAAAGGNGTSRLPFNTFAAGTLAGAGGAGDLDDADDYIFVHAAAVSITSGIELELNQHLIGEAAGLSINRNLNGNGAPTLLVAPGSRPAIANAAGNAVAISNAIPIEVIGLALSGSVNAIDLTSAGALPAAANLTIANNVINGAGAEGIDINLNAGTTGTLTLTINGNTWNTGGTHTGNAVDIVRNAGTLNLNFSSNTNIKSNATAVNINGGAVANANITGFANNSIHQSTVGAGVTISNMTFDANPAAGGFQQVNAGTLAVGVSGDGVGTTGVDLTTVQGDLFFTDLDVFAGTSALTVAGTGTGLILGVTPSVSTLSAPNGAAVNITLATINLQLSSLTSTVTGGAANGVSLTTVTGTFSSPGSITSTNSTGTAFNISGGSANVTYSGTISWDVGRLVNIASTTGGTKTFSGAITDNGDGDGGETGVSMTGNAAAATVTFSGGLVVRTTANPAFTATGGGTIAVCNENPCNPAATGALINTLSSTTGTALNVANSTIGANRLEFRSISANGAANGIVLTNTGALGGLTIAGSGNTTQGGDFSGGTIQNTTGHGIALTNTTGPSFRNLRLLNTGDSGVNGTQVNGFSFTDGTITGAGDASDENSITFDDSLTTANLTGVVTITNNVISQTEAEGIDILNFAGTITSANISGNALSDTGDVATPGSAISVIASGTPTTAGSITTATISNNTITDFRAGVGVQVRAGNVNAGGPAGHAGIAGSATDVITITGNLMNGGSGGIGNQPDRFFTGGAAGIGQGNFNISNNGTAANRLRNIDCIAIEVQADGPVNMTSIVQNNFINANSAVGCAGIAIGTDDPNDMGAGTHTTLISGNNVMGTDGPGIFAIIRDSPSTMMARIINNTVAAPIATNAARAGIRVDSGSAQGDTTLCLEITGNTTAGSTNTGTSTTSPGINLRKQGTNTAVNTFGIEGLSPSPTGTPNVENHVNSLNTSTSGTFGVNGTALLSATTGFTSCVVP